MLFRKGQTLKRKGRQRPLYKLEFSVLDKFDSFQDSYEIDRLTKIKLNKKMNLSINEDKISNDTVII